MSKFPQLLIVETLALHAIGDSLHVGRSLEAEVCVFDDTCSRQRFRIVRRDAGYFVEVLQTYNPTYHDGVAVADSIALAHGSVLQAGRSRFQFLLTPADEATFSRLSALAPVDILLPLPHTGVVEIGREPSPATLVLPHPQVSRRHAAISRTESAAHITDLGSANGTYVNGRRITGPTVLRIGDEIDIGPFALRFTGAALASRSRADNLQLMARDVAKVGVGQGAPVTLLDAIDLVIRPREFACVIGPSGSGKSTLLSVLSGRHRPNNGVVRINGADLHAQFDALKQSIAVVPQQEALFPSLTVEQALRYTAKLRLPPDTSEEEMSAIVTEVLDTVNLSDNRHTTIRYLSGGERKRVSLANEILCKPSLLLLDEVTSGLDEQSDRDMMRLFRGLADSGKTVVCVTHTLANVEGACHLVVVLARGGVLAFVGAPADALAYFQIHRLADVYDRLTEKPADYWRERFRASPFWQRYVAGRMTAPSPLAPPTTDFGSRHGPGFGDLPRQAWVLTLRYAAIWRGDPVALIGIVAQAIVVACLLSLLFGNLDALPRRTTLEEATHAHRRSTLLFLLAVASFWFGCNNSAKEIVKERTIFLREADFNVRVVSYYGSKLTLLTAFSAMQTILLWVITWLVCRPPMGFGDTLVVLLALALAGVAVGLALSSFANTEEMAITLVPLAILPQIILSGAIAPLEGASEWLAASAVTIYWGKQALDALSTATSPHRALTMLMLHTALAMTLAHLALYLRTSQRP